MFRGRATQEDPVGVPLRVQSVETGDGWLAVRVRSDVTEAVGRHEVLTPVLGSEQFTLTDEQGHTLSSGLVQSSSGPLLGVIDITFDEVGDFKLDGTLRLQSASADVRFTITE